MSNITDNILFKEEWLSIKQHNGYSYVHEEKCNGKLIAILPYRKKSLSIEYLMRMEICPAHSNEHELCCIIGSCDNIALNEDNTAIKELKEEAGYTISIDQLIPLGWCWDAKVADTKVYLYTCDLTDVKIGFATTDGTELEASAYCNWMDINSLKETHDPKVFMMVDKIRKEL